MGIKKTWQTTLSFRKFRQKTHELSKIFWIQQLGVDSITSLTKNLDPNAFIAKELPCSFEFHMYPATIQQTLQWLPNYLERTRLYFLVVYTAFLESYLKEITFIYIASKGYLEYPSGAQNLLKLSPTGKALGAPVLERSTIPAMLKYASSLFNLDFGKDSEDWIRIYRLRCEVAHNGGIATPELLKQISGLKLELAPKENEMLGLTWDELRTFMRAADDMAAVIDSTVSSYPIKLVETEQTLRELAILGQLPQRKNLWSYMHTEFSLRIKRPDKIRLEQIFY